MKRTKLKDRTLPKYTKGEEIFNMTSHIVGAVLGIVALVLCIIFSAIHHNPYGVVSSSIFGVTMILLYTMHAFSCYKKSCHGNVAAFLCKNASF